MNDDLGLHPAGYVPAADPEPAPPKRPGRARTLGGILLLALLVAVGVIFIAPSPVKKLLARFIDKHPKPAAVPVADTGPLPAVPTLWEKLAFGALPADVAQDLKSGKYYYDKRLPGNFGLAIQCWKRAMAGLGAVEGHGVRQLVASAEAELACQYSSDSGDAFVLLKQGRRDQAILLLDKMRADYPDITTPQYRWASVMLSRYRR